MTYTFDDAMATFKWRRAAANAYMKERGIGASAVDLIPAEIRQPIPLLAHIDTYEHVRDPFAWMISDTLIAHIFGAKLTDDQINKLMPDWTHTPGRMKLGAILVRNVWSRA